MDLTAGLAAYGAALSTGIAVAQAVRWFQASRTKIRIEVDEGFASPIGSSDDGPWSVVLWVDVINEGLHDEQIAWIFLDVLEGEGDWNPSGGQGEEHVLEPRHRRTYILAEEPVSEQENAHLTIPKIQTPYRVRVVSGAGKELCSETFPTPDRSIDE